MTRRSVFALVVASLIACDAGPAEPPEDGYQGAIVRIRGRVYTADRAALPDVSIRVARPDYEAVAAVDGQGHFVVEAPAEGAAFNVSVGAAGGRYHRSLRRLEPLSADWNGVDVLLVPNRLSITAGSYAGREVTDLSLDVAFAPENGTNGALYAAYNAFPPGTSPPQAWRFTSAYPASAFPLSLYFLHDGIGHEGHPRAAITPEDSATLWSVIADLEARVGMDLFRPARLDDLPADTLSLRGGAAVVRTFSVALEQVPGLGASGGFAGASVLCNDERPDPGDEGCSLFGHYTLVHGRVTLAAISESILDRFVAQHELIHALGFGHACHTPTIMTGCPEGYPRRSYPGTADNTSATVYDIAYIQLHRMLHERTAELVPEFGIREALDAERRFALEKPPLPANWPLPFTIGASGPNRSDRSGAAPGRR